VTDWVVAGSDVDRRLAPFDIERGEAVNVADVGGPARLKGGGLLMKEAVVVTWQAIQPSDLKEDRRRNRRE
jgi:hypothetical protein